MKTFKNITKLSLIILVFVLSFFFIQNKDSYGIYRETLNVTVDLSVKDSSDKYTVSFVSYGGGDFDSRLKSYNEEIGTLPVPHKENYNFLGWYTELIGGVKVSADTKVTSTMTLHARYAKIVCKMATSLHNVGSTYFGTIPNSTTLSAGFAYDCDMNDDGNYNERFYYLTYDDYKHAVLIYYNNVNEGEAVCNAPGVLYNEARHSYEAPTNAYTHLPDASVWSNVQLYNLPRQIVNQDGGTTAYGHTIETFDYSGKSSRFATTQEIARACNLESISTTNTNFGSNCRFLLENTSFYDYGLSEACRTNYWLENPLNNPTLNKLYRISKQNNGCVETVDINDTSKGFSGVRPAIEVPLIALETYAGVPLTNYTVTFDSQEGSSVPSVTRFENEAIGELPTPTRAGYTFGGWYTDTSYQTEITSATLIKNDVTFYAKWNQVIDQLDYVFHVEGTCTFNGKPTSTDNRYMTSATNDCISNINPTGEPIDYIATGHNYIDTQVPLFNAGNYEKDFEIGFTIESYNPSEQGESQVSFVNAKLENKNEKWPGVAFRRVNATNSVEISENIEGVKQFQTFDLSFPSTVRIYRRNGVVSYSISTVDGGEEKILQDTSGTSDYFNFYTWFGASEVETNREATTAGAQRYIKATMSNMYIKLQRDEDATTHTVNFDADGGTYTEYSDTRTVSDGAAIGPLPVVEKNHFTFVGWFTDPQGGTQITEATTITADVTYYAHYTADTYTISFDEQGGTTVNDITGTFNQPIGELPTTSKTGYTFDGWYTDPEGGTKVTSQTLVTATVTYYAHYTPIEYTITFNTHGGSAVSNITGDYNTEIGTLPTTSKTGLRFVGWFTEAEGGTQIDEHTLILGNATYHAHYTNLDLYTITFDPDGGTVSPLTKSVEEGSAVGELPTPTYDGHVFDAWYIGEIPVDETRVPLEDETYVARWESDSKVAKIGHVFYDTLQEAINAVPTNGTETTITVLKDIDGVNVQVAAGKNIVFDLQDYTLSASSGKIIDNSGTIEIKNGHIIRNGSNDQQRVIANNHANAVIKITGGEILHNSFQAIQNNNGTIYISGGTVSIGTGVEQGVINNEQNGKMYVSGGRITAYKRQALYNDKGILEISGDVILENNTTNSGRATVQSTGGTLTIKGGTIISASYSGVKVTGGTFTIGEENGAHNKNTPTIRGAGSNGEKGYGVYSTVNYSFYDGTLKGTVAAVNDKTKINNVEDGAVEVEENETIGTTTYHNLYYTLSSTPDSYTISLNANQGTVSPTSISVEPGNAVSGLPTPVRNGFVFDGWYLENTFDTLVVEGETTPDGDDEYFAKWTPSVTSATITNETIDLVVGENETINVTNVLSIEPFTYSSSSTDVATVSSVGVVTAVGPGHTTVVLTGTRSHDTKTVTINVQVSADVETFDIMPTPIRTYFNNIDSWSVGQTDSSHASFDTAMTNNLNTNNCVYFTNDNRDTELPSSGTKVYCDQPNKYDTGVTGDITVYEYDVENNTKKGVATYVSVDSGKIYNVIPGTTYYWELNSDTSQNGKFYAYGERRILSIDNADGIYKTRNVRDLGGLAVSYKDEDNNDVTGTIKYGKLYRGEKIFGGSGNSAQYYTKLGITHEMDLRGPSEVQSNEDRVGTNITSTGTTFEIIHYAIDYDSDNANYLLARNALLRVMNGFIEADENNEDFSLYFHCRIGADRTGTLAYLLEGLLGVSQEDRYRDYELTVFFGLRERTRFYLAKGSNDKKFIYLKQAIRNASNDGSEDVVAWFLKGSSNPTEDMETIQKFREIMIEKNN